MKFVLDSSKEISKNQMQEIDNIADIMKGTWNEACNNFYLTSKVKKDNQLKPPSGIQPFINEVLIQKFTIQNWIGDESRFTKNNTWLRITFRHQMSLGSDLLDSIKLIKLEKMHLCIILAAKNDFLKIISPNDWRSLCSFEKLKLLHSQVESMFNLPIIIGYVEPEGTLSLETHNLIYGDRLKF